MTTTTYQGTGAPLLLDVAQDQVEDEGSVMDSTEHDWTELREAVAKALGCDAETLRPAKR